MERHHAPVDWHQKRLRGQVYAHPVGRTLRHTSWRSVRLAVGKSLRRSTSPRPGGRCHAHLAPGEPIFHLLQLLLAQLQLQLLELNLLANILLLIGIARPELGLHDPALRPGCGGRRGRAPGAPRRWRLLLLPRVSACSLLALLRARLGGSRLGTGPWLRCAGCHRSLLGLCRLRRRRLLLHLRLWSILEFVHELKHHRIYPAGRFNRQNFVRAALCWDENRVRDPHGPGIAGAGSRSFLEASPNAQDRASLDLALARGRDVRK
mmetsp:Transcript_100836/g.181946  ORF Transcript_100836/g.181946 Transcript_100836/m.181946 type:complete len:264 (+) Transcript_100836:1549-2340(+)